jgi:hypothetical protein
MKLSNKKTYILLFICVFLFFLIFYWIHYLTHNYIIECFSNKTSHTVDLPLTTTYSCKNFCNPSSRCAVTGQQCFTDIDCPGCQPYVPPLNKNSINNVPGNDDAGKLTWGVTPQYSTLTSGYGTREKIITDNVYSKPSDPNFGVNTWKSEYNEELKLFDERYKPNKLPYMPEYPERYSLSGEFIEDGPLPSNSYLSTSKPTI